MRRVLATVILEAPVWPQQAWYPLLLESVSDFPLLIQNSPDILTNSLGDSHPLVRVGSLSLAVWRLSGVPSEVEAFRTKLWNCYKQESGETLPKRMIQPGVIGWAGASSGVPIPFREI